MSLVLNTGLGLGGGSDKHNLGWFTDDAALAEAYPVGNDGAYALVGSTDTIWTWDSDTTAWVDTDRKGQVSSVNNETGDVTVQETLVNQQNIKSINGSSILGSGNLEIDALPSQSGNAGKILDTDGTNAAWETKTTITMRTWGANE